MNNDPRTFARARKREVLDRLDPQRFRTDDKPVLERTNIRYEISERNRGIAMGGIGVVRLLADQLGLTDAIDTHVRVLKVHRPYHESDHVLAVAFNVLNGGTCLEDLELMRRDPAFLDALGAQSVPDPTTAGDFTRRFGRADIENLMTAANETRVKVWRQQPAAFREEAVIDADGTFVLTDGECKQGIDITYKGDWGYHALLLSLANTREPIFLEYRPGNRPSHEGAAVRFDQAAELVRKAGFARVVFRGDTDFSQTKHLDRWHDAGIEFVFGIDKNQAVQAAADALSPSLWRFLERPPKYEVKTKLRTKRGRQKEKVVVEREFRNLTQVDEMIAEFDYRPTACSRPYRVVALRKIIRVTVGQRLLVPEERFFFYVTNRRDRTAEQIVFFANDRGDQEKLIEQLKNGVPALHAPVDTLHANWAYSVMASLAWSLKAWLALSLPVHPLWESKHRAEQQRILGMEFRTFMNAFLRIPALIVRAARRVVFRLIGCTEDALLLLRAAKAFRTARIE